MPKTTPPDEKPRHRVRHRATVPLSRKGPMRFYGTVQALDAHGHYYPLYDYTFIPVILACHLRAVRGEKSPPPGTATRLTGLIRTHYGRNHCADYSKKKRHAKAPPSA